MHAEVIVEKCKAVICPSCGLGTAYIDKPQECECGDIQVSVGVIKIHRYLFPDPEEEED